MSITEIPQISGGEILEKVAFLQPRDVISLLNLNCDLQARKRMISLTVYEAFLKGVCVLKFRQRTSIGDVYFGHFLFLPVIYSILMWSWKKTILCICKCAASDSSIDTHFHFLLSACFLNKTPHQLQKFPMFCLKPVKVTLRESSSHNLQARLRDCGGTMVFNLASILDQLEALRTFF